MGLVLAFGIGMGIGLGLGLMGVVSGFLPMMDFLPKPINTPKKHRFESGKP